MVKFGTQLELNTFPEWSKHYVRYRQLKNAINQLFPTEQELKEEEQADAKKAKASLLRLTDPRAAEEGEIHGIESSRGGDESEPLLTPSPSSGDLSASPDSLSAAPINASISPPPLPTTESTRLQPPSGTVRSAYGGLEDDPRLGGRNKSASANDLKKLAAASQQRSEITQVEVLINDFPTNTNGLNSHHHDPDSPIQGDPHMGRALAKRHLQRAATVQNLRSSFSLASHQEKLDSISIKILSELQKVDEFHKMIEAKILTTFESIRKQAEDLLTQREQEHHPSKLPKEGIMKRLKVLKIQREKEKAKHQMKHYSSENGTAASTGTNGNSDQQNNTIAAGIPSPSPSPSPLPGHSSSPSADVLHAHPHLTYHGHQYSRRHSFDHEKDDEMDALPLKSAFIALLRRTTMLIHFVDINYVAFMKLLKVFDKRTTGALRQLNESDPLFAETRDATNKVLSQLKSSIQNKGFYTSRALDDRVLPEVYRLFSELFEHGNLEKGKLVLLSTMTEQQYTRTDSFWLGMKVGVIAMLLGLLGVILIRPVKDLDLVKEMTFFAPVYRGFGMLITFMWFWSFLVWIWDEFRIPYVLIFQLNPRTRLTHFNLQTEAANFTIVYLFNSLLFLTHAGRFLFDDFSLVIYPVALCFYVLIKLFTPSRLVSNWNSRQMLLSTIGQIIIAPFGKVRFMEAFVGDILTSMVKIFVDVESSFCLFVTWFYLSPIDGQIECSSVSKVIVPIICALPLWWRFLQCLRRYYDTQKRTPHLGNAVKYLITHSVVIMAAYHPIFQDHHASQWETYRIIWLGCTIVSTLYTTWWDMVMDWGLLFASHPHPDYPGLRSELVFTNHIWFYYWAMISNALLRWVWVITIIPFSFEDGSDKSWTPTTYFGALVSYDQVIVPLLGTLELFRRFQWSILRVENEQIVQGTHLRVDAHLPVFIQQMQKTKQEKKDEDEEKGYGIVTEVIGMVIVLLLIAIVAALS